MNSAVYLFNKVFGTALDLLLYPFSGLAPIWGLLFISILSGVVLLLIYGRVSNQAGLRAVKRKIGACILEAVIYRHDLHVSLRAQGRMFLHGFRYFGFALLPILILMVPCLILLAGLNVRYGALPFKVGDHALVSAVVASGTELRAVRLSQVPGVKVSPPDRDLQARKISWRVDFEAAGQPRLDLTLPSGQVTQQLFAGGPAPLISSGSYSSWFWTLLFPGGVRLPSSLGLEAVETQYPEARYNLLGLELHWVVVFLIVSILAGLVGSKFFDVEI